MLFIKEGPTEWGEQWHRWHVGEPLPEMTRRVVTFQADGDELEVILAALRGTRKKEGECS